MDKIMEFSRDIQKILLRKEREYGQLKFISSRATKKTSDFINELVQTITDVIHTHQIIPNNLDKTPINKVPSAVQCYKYFLLNTHFPSQQLLTEDLLHGHIVGLWPSLSPYLFIQIIWHLNFEMILVYSIMFIPLDLCVQILEIAIKCVEEMDVTRAENLLFKLNAKIYFKCLQLQYGTLSAESVTERADQLVASFQTVLDLLGKFYRFTGLSNEEKYKKHGHALKKFLRNVKLCINNKIENVAMHINNIEIADLYKLTYGNPDNCTSYHCTLTGEEVHSIVETMKQELVALLLNEIKQVDCLEYMSWAEIDDTEDVIFSLQRAIIVECHYFMEFMKEDEFLANNDHLCQCLQQLMGSENFEKSILTLQELCYIIDNGRPEDMKELLKRYKTWDQSTLKFICERVQLLNKDDYNVLLEHLHHMYKCPYTMLEKYRSYITVIKVLVQQNMSFLYGAVLRYTVRHYTDNHLQHLYNQEIFETFMSSNESIRSPLKLRSLMLFILLNAKKVLTTLVEITIGDLKYVGIVFTPSFLLLLRSFYEIMYCESTVLTHILKEILMQNREFDCKKFAEFLDVMLKKQVINADDLMNIVYIPYLSDSPFKYYNLTIVLLFVESALKSGRCTSKTNYTLLIIALAKKMWVIRKCDLRHARIKMNDVINHVTNILKILCKMPNLLTESQQCEIIHAISSCVEPIDRVRLASLPIILECDKLSGSVLEVIQDYERRCFAIYQQLRLNTRNDSILQEYAHSFVLNRETFIRHMMLHVTENECESFALELTTVFWCHFGWINEFDAYENMLRIIAEAAQLSLMFNKVFPNDSFIILLRTIMSYSKTFVKVSCINLKEIHCILLKIMLFIKKTVDRTHYSKIYDLLHVDIMNICLKELNSYSTYFKKINDLLKVYFVRCNTLMVEEDEEDGKDKMRINENSSDDETSTSFTHEDPNYKEFVSMLNSYLFVCECIKISNTEAYCSINWIRNFILKKNKLH